MTSDLVFVRGLIVSREAGLRGLFRHASSSSPIPLEIIEAPDATAACIDLIYLDGDLPAAEITRVIGSPAVRPSFSILLGSRRRPLAGFSRPMGLPLNRCGPKQYGADRPLGAPTGTEPRAGGRRFLDHALDRQKALAATHFEFAITEAGEGLAALKLVREGDFHIVFLDYNMPDRSGLETLADFRCEKRPVSVVLISSTQDETVAERARAEGAAFLKKPFFPADIENALCGFYGLRALNPKRA
jgi:CheY-like chemotaxis protein